MGSDQSPRGEGEGFLIESRLDPNAGTVERHPKGEMTRGQQTAWIVAAIVGALLAYFIYDATVNPNLDGMHPYDRCAYWAYWHNHGGSVKSCQDKEIQAVYKRVQSLDEPTEPLYNASSTGQDNPNVPTKF
jgi:hypothetical protein